MKLTGIKLTNFRNLESLSLSPNPSINLITGANGSGKTSILEAIFYGCTAKSFRGATDEVLLRRSAEVCRIEIAGEIQNQETTVEIAWGKTGQENEKGRTAVRPYGKQIKVDGVKLNRLADLFDYFHAVSFTPEDTDLIYGAPAVRRKLLDLYLSQSERGYLSDLLEYNRVMQQRNALLKEFSIDDEESTSMLDMLEVWDNQLASVGARIIARRVSMIDSTREKLSHYYRGIESGSSELTWKYESSVIVEDDLHAAFLQKLKDLRRKDLYFGSTSAGPHRDDLSILLNGNATRDYASQGEAKSAALAIKFTIFDFLSDKLHDPPLLLLDEISSDLDQDRLLSLTKLLPNLGQVFLTTAKPAELLQEISSSATFIIENGCVKSS